MRHGIGPNRASRAANKASNGKPFVYDELVARAVLRRASGPRHSRIAVRDLEIDLAARIVSVGGEQVQLFAKEYELLVALAEDPERVFKKEELLRDVGGFRSLGRTRRTYPIRPNGQMPSTTVVGRGRTMNGPTERLNQAV